MLSSTHKFAEKEGYPFCTGNPSTVVGGFFQNAKKYKHDKLAKMTKEEWQDLQFIMYNKSYASFDGRKLSNLLQGIIFKNVKWEELKAHGLTEPLTEAITSLYGGFSNRDFSMVFRSLSQLSMGKQAFRESPFCDLFIKGITQHLNQFNIVDLSVVFLTLVALGFNWLDLKSMNLDKPLLQVLDRQISDLEDLSAANFLWSFAHLDVPWSELKALNLDRHLLQTVEKVIPQCSITLLDQIQHAKLWYEFVLEGDSQKILEERLSELPKPKSSEFHKNVAAMIFRLTDEPFEIEKCFEKVLFVDLCFGKTGFEINGPHHEDIEQLDIFKAKVLGKNGVTIECIDYKDDITNDYLKQKLRKNGIPLKENNFQLVRSRRSSSFNRSNFQVKEEELPSTSNVPAQIGLPHSHCGPIQEVENNPLVIVPAAADEKVPSFEIPPLDSETSPKQARHGDEEKDAAVEPQPIHVETASSSTAKKKKKIKKKGKKAVSNEQNQQPIVIAKECNTPKATNIKNYKLWGGLFAVGAAAVIVTSASHFILNPFESMHKQI